MDLSAEQKAIVEAVIERAEQACRYAVKHQNFTGDDDYRKGFEDSGTICEQAIRDQVMRHIVADLERLERA